MIEPSQTTEVAVLYPILGAEKRAASMAPVSVEPPEVPCRASLSGRCWPRASGLAHTTRRRAERRHLEPGIGESIQRQVLGENVHWGHGRTAR
jgi:hypothetical protein